MRFVSWGDDNALIVSIFRLFAQNTGFHTMHRIAQHINVLGVMAGKKDGFSRLLALQNQLSDFRHADMIQAVERLVQNHQFRIAHDGLGNAQPLAHAQRILADLLVNGIMQTDPIQGFDQLPARQLGVHGGQHLQIEQPAVAGQKADVVLIADGVEEDLNLRQEEQLPCEKAGRPRR